MTDRNEFIFTADNKRDFDLAMWPLWDLEQKRYTHLMQTAKEQQGEIKKPSLVISAKKQRKIVE